MDKRHHNLVRVAVLNSPDHPKTDHGLVRVVTESKSEPVRRVTADDLPRSNKVALAAGMIAGEYGDVAAARNHFGLTAAEAMAAMEEAKRLAPKPPRSKFVSPRR